MLVKFTAIELSQDLPSANQDALSGLGNLTIVASGLGQLFPELEQEHNFHLDRDSASGPNMER